MKQNPGSLASIAAAMAILIAAPLGAGPPQGEGWVSLFNGKDLTDWKIPEGDNGHWKVVDGVIDYDAQSEAKDKKDLWSEKEYGDFTLMIDWRLKQTTGLYKMSDILPDGSDRLDENGEKIVLELPNADSGIFVRGNSKSQINIWCWPVGSGEVWGYRRDAKMPPEVRAGVTPNVKADNPVGEWNTFEITMKGEHLSVTLNGKPVIESVQLPGVPETGPIALQHHGGMRDDGTYSPASSLIQFRNIYIKELN